MNNFPSVLESTADLSDKHIQGLLELASKFQKRESSGPSFPKIPVVSTFFLENSTRTKNSFAVAAMRLGAHYIDFNPENSSLNKGERLEETFRTLHCQGVELLIVRASESQLLSEFKKSTPIRLINGGDGTHQHPTQALLDLMTLQNELGNISGKKIAIIGDCRHSRVANSLIELLPRLGMKITLCGPKHFLPTSNIPNIEMTTELEDTFDCDALYLLRIQKERHINDIDYDYSLYPDEYGISLKKIEPLKKKIPIYHPGPANIGMEIGEDVIHSPFYRGYHQVKNSVPMRMAIIQAILQNGDKSIGQACRLDQVL